MLPLSPVDLVQVLSIVIALVWGAAIVKSTVGRLEKTAGKLERTLDAIRQELSDHHARLRVLEDRAGVAPPFAPRRAVGDPELRRGETS